jgi:phage gpG-like protein
VIAETTLQGLELITQNIKDVRSHSGKHRKQNPQPTVTDLVDTGFLINSFQADVSVPNRGVIGTNTEYAAALEYGTAKMRPFGYMRKTKVQLRRKLKDNVAAALARVAKQRTTP